MNFHVPIHTTEAILRGPETLPDLFTPPASAGLTRILERLTAIEIYQDLLSQGIVVNETDVALNTEMPITDETITELQKVVEDSFASCIRPDDDQPFD